MGESISRGFLSLSSRRVLMLAPLFLAIGLPVEGIGILIAVDAIPDVFSTVLKVTGDLAAAAIIQRGESPTSAATGPP